MYISASLEISINKNITAHEISINLASQENYGEVRLRQILSMESDDLIEFTEAKTNGGIQSSAGITSARSIKTTDLNP